MAEETQYTANTGVVQINTGNSSLTGSGTLNTNIWNVIQGGSSSNGTLIKTVFIKAITNTTEGMIRFFVDDGTNIRLIKEVTVDAITKASINPAFEARVDLNFVLKSGYYLKVTTQNSETFNIIAEGQNWAYYSTSVRLDTTKYNSNTGTGIVDTANANLDGSGALTAVYTAGSSPTYNGSSISSITIKSLVGETPGMIRLYLDNGSSKFCFSETVVPTVTPSATDQAFEHTIVFDNDLDIQAGYKIQASTEVGLSTHVCVEGNDWNYYS